VELPRPAHRWPLLTPPARADTDGDGQLSAADVVRLMQAMGRGGDLNGDGDTTTRERLATVSACLLPIYAVR